MMKILICIHEYPPEQSWGMGNATHSIVENLRKKNIDCTVITATGGDISMCNRDTLNRLYRFKPLYHIYKVHYVWHKISRYIKKHHREYDRIWINRPNPLFFRSKTGKEIVTLHSMYYGYPLDNSPLMQSLYYRFMAFVEKHKYKRTCWDFTCVSEELCERLKEIGVDESRITCIPNGVDTEQFKPAQNKKELRKKWSIPGETTALLSVGRLHDAKQPLLLMEVFSQIQKELKNTTLLVAGTGDLLEETKRFVEKENIKNVRFLGQVDHEKELPDLMACSDYYIMTSKYEGQPLTLLEAMSTGLPCIVADIPNLSIVKEINCGLVVDFRQENSREKIIRYIQEDKPKHSKNARRYILNNSDWEKITEKYLDEFNTNLK